MPGTDPELSRQLQSELKVRRVQLPAGIGQPGDDHSKKLADCVVLTHDGKLYMQRRPDNWHSFPGVISLFGGHVEPDETPDRAVVRELNEETGARIDSQDLIFIGAVTEDCTAHVEIIHVYFWHDRKNTITGCYEAEPALFNSAQEVLLHPKVMDYAKWALLECRSLGLL
jgi:8-oxo-dGTP diphosphatase